MSIVKAIRKYGEDSFHIESLLQDDDNLWLLKVAEPLLISVFLPEYNCTSGGEGALGYKHTDDAKRKFAMSMKGKKHTLSHRRLMSEKMKGRCPVPLAHKRAKELFGHPVKVDGVSFPSKNEAARYLKEKYGLSRNTALRRIDEGLSNFKLKRIPKEDR